MTTSPEPVRDTAGWTQPVEHIGGQFGHEICARDAAAVVVCRRTDERVAATVVNVIATAVSLSVSDLTASSRFFTIHLGFRELVTADGVVCLGRDDSACDVVLVRRDSDVPAGAPIDRGPERMIVSFTVTGIAAEQERLRGEGADITMPLRREPWGEWVLQLTDPNGVVIQLVEWLPPAGL